MKHSHHSSLKSKPVVQNQNPKVPAPPTKVHRKQVPSKTPPYRKSLSQQQSFEIAWKQLEIKLYEQNRILPSNSSLASTEEQSLTTTQQIA